MNINLFKYVLGPFFGGVLFALGLGISGMTEASNIIGFLDILGHWKPALIFVLASALITYGILFRIITKLPKPLVDTIFHIPTLIKIDRRLVIGSLLFGVGWGITGLCPGPGLVSLTSVNPHALTFVVTMIIGMVLGNSKLGKKV
jgi:uncharacterized membrane protein YedE/YeeE